MRVMTSGEEARKARVHVASEDNDSSGWVSEYFGMTTALALSDGVPPDHGARCPQGFLVEQSANCTVGIHFHLVDQFQVVVRGGGHLGRQPVGRVAIHFASGSTPYGPIVSGDEGISYLTLRNSWDSTVVHFMPGARKALRPGPHRHVVLDPVLPLPPEILGGLLEAATTTLLEPDAEGLGAWLHRLPPGGRLHGAAPASGAGQYWVVLAGGMRVEDRTEGPMTCLFLSEDEPPLEITAGKAGAELLVLQFPKNEGAGLN